MSAENIRVDAEQVPIGSIRPHPGNARRGNVAVITESLRTNSQYKPILVHRPTGHILAGTHTWKAARKLGWASIGVTFTDCTEAQAVQIMLADNRASDAGYTDPAAAFELAAGLPDLLGTGYTQEDFELPDIDLDAFNPDRGQDDGERDDAEPAPPPQAKPLSFQMGTARGSISPAAYEAWRGTLPRAQADAVDVMLTRLGLVEEISTTTAAPNTVSTAWALIRDLVPYPGNPRQGDVGMLTGLLRIHGQYRPIVVNKRNNRVLAGNHLMEAAKQLGWERIGVSWVDADADTEKRIVLVDNRASDLASYDMEALGRLVSGTGAAGIEAAGYTLGDLDDIIAGKQLREPDRTGGAAIVVGKLRAKVRPGLLAEQAWTPGQELVEAAMMLGISPDQVGPGR
jgi:ParB-like chromosome segregation protein Spo0J